MGSDPGGAAPVSENTGRAELSSRRAWGVWLGLTAAYAVLLLGLASLGLFGMVWKTVVIPALFIAAALLGRLRAFVLDWGIFLGATILFDSLRGLIYTLINRYDLPVYMGYAIDMERALLGTTLPEMLQQAWLDPGNIDVFDRFLVVVHASHFLFFLFFALLIWMVRGEDFGRFKLAMVLMMYLGLLGYLLIPTVPPWMATEAFEMFTPITHLTREVYNITLPALQKSFATNPVAAMPSLHAAFPALMVLIAFHHFRWRSWAMILYSLAAFLAITYLGEHYLVDVLAGVVLAAGCYLLAYRWDRLRGFASFRRGAQETRRGASTAGQTPPLGFAWSGNSGARARILLMVLLLALGQGIGLWSQDFHWQYKPSVAFIERELDGRSPTADFHRGRRAFERTDFPLAQQTLATAVDEVTSPANAAMARFLLGMSALHNGDAKTAIEFLEQIPLPILGPQAGLMLARAQLSDGRREAGFETLDELTEYFGTVREFVTSKAELEYESGRISAEEYRARLAK